MEQKQHYNERSKNSYDDSEPAVSLDSSLTFFLKEYALFMIIELDPPRES